MLDTPDRRTLLAGAAASAFAPRAAPAAALCCPIVELRQYTLHDGRRDTLIDLFDREFVESQETAGMRVIGQFRDLDDPNRFVWLRGFETMEARRLALTAFYTGPVWKAHRGAANATMVDSDNVLLLRPASPANGFDLPDRRAEDASNAIVTASIHYIDRLAADALVAFFASRLAPRIREAGASLLASFRTLHAPNSFPALPVRDRESVFVWFARFEAQDELNRFDERLRALPDPRAEAPPGLLAQLMRKPERLRLAPTPRSLLR